MELLLDLGNSCCKYAVLENGKITKYESQSYGPFGKQYSVKSLCDQFDKLEKIIICSVLSEDMNAEIKAMLLKTDLDSIYFIEASDNCFGVELAYADPGTFGVDRLAALVALKEKYTGNSCVIDCGTAVTIDALEKSGRHLGGVIMPGIEVMKSGLLASTKIKDVKNEPAFSVFAKNTQNAIYSGCASAVAGGVEYVVDKMISDNGQFNHIVLTGGGISEVSARFTESFSSLVTVDETLVLDGLFVISKHI